MSKLAQHSSTSNSWGTPSEIMKPIKQTLGQIDLDPCSTELHNKTIEAKAFLTEADNSLAMPYWVTTPSTIFINPPSGRSSELGCSKPIAFWKKLCEHVFNQKVKHAIFLGFSLEQLPQSQDCFWSFTDYPTLLVRKRIKFEDPSNNKRANPTHSNFITYVPGSINKTNDFFRNFTHLGEFISGSNYYVL